MAKQAHQHKRHGKHHKQTKPFLNVYYPYLPLLLMAIVVTVVFSLNKPRFDVLSYATNVSPSGLLRQTNEQRKSHKVSALKLNSKLARAAQKKANDMTKQDYWSHSTPDGSAPWKFIDSTGYKYQKAGENLAYGFSNSSNTVYAWMNSKLHRANILDGVFRDVGFGIANSPNFVGQGNETVVVALYAVPDGLVAGKSNMNDAGFNTASLLNAEPSSQKISKIELFARGGAPWAASAIGILIGVSLALLFVKHSLALKRTIKRGERFVVKHPWIDLIVVVLAIIGLVLISGAGLVR